MLKPRENTLYAETTVTVGDIQTTYSFTGSLAAPRSQTIVSAAAGRVKEVYVEANELVEEGDRILALSTGEIIRAEIDGEVVSLGVEKDVDKGVSCPCEASEECLNSCPDDRSTGRTPGFLLSSPSSAAGHRQTK